jgi:hypothetical protein
MDRSKLPFSSLDLPQRYRALETRFELMKGYDGSCAFILAIDPDEFRSVHNVGSEKLMRLNELQELLPERIEAYWRRREELAGLQE